MFFRKKNIAPYRQQAKFEMKHDGISDVYVLSNGLFLSIKASHKDEITTLALFNPKTSTKAAERLFITHSVKMIPLDDECFLLQTHDDKLHILSSKNLETLEDLQEMISKFDTTCPISNHRFLTIHEQIKTNVQLTLASHDCKTKKFYQKPVLLF
jgi:hypothetical protein